MLHHLAQHLLSELDISLPVGCQESVKSVQGLLCCCTSTAAAIPAACLLLSRQAQLVEGPAGQDLPVHLHRQVATPASS